MANLEKRYTDDEIIAALRFTGGDVYGAAARLGCSPSTVTKRKLAVPRVAEAIIAIRGETRFGLVNIWFEQAIAKARSGDTDDLQKLVRRLDGQLGETNESQPDESKSSQSHRQPQPVEHDSNSVPISDSERLAELMELCDSLREREAAAAVEAENAGRDVPSQTAPEAA